jgi:hypothetical protein
MPATCSETASEAFRSGEQALRDREVAAACIAFDEAQRLGYDPDACSGARWTCHMLNGNFEAGWKESDRIARRQRLDPNRFWTGKPLAGCRVLIRCLHGLGDTIHFIRYAALLRKQARSVVIESQPLLKELLSVSALADDVITWGEAEPQWDEQVEIIELPRIFRTTLSTIPANVPYLRTGRDRTGDLVRAGTPGQLRVGLVWAGSSYDPTRSVPPALLDPLLETPGVRFSSLQGEPDRAQLGAMKAPVQDLYDPSGSILAAAQSLQKLDLLITVDTMMAHLAGALAIPCWTLLPFRADWRWLLNRSDSPWYPTMRLFRQKRQGDWGDVIAEVAAALASQVADTSLPLVRNSAPTFERSDLG